MTTTTFQIATGEFGLSLTDPGTATAAAAELANYTDFSCTAIEALVTGTSQGSFDDVPRPFCGNAAPPVYNAESTQYEIAVTAFQDPQEAAGLLAFCYTNDSGITNTPVWFYIGGFNEAGIGYKAVGRCFIGPAELGGEAGPVLTTDMTWVVQGTPDVEFGATPPAT